VAALVRSTFGFGESLIAVPLFLLFLPLNVAVPLSVLLSVVIALIVVVQDHQKVHFRSASWLILFAVPGIPLGVILLVYGNEQMVKAGLGMLIILYSLYTLFDKKNFTLKKDSMTWLAVCGFLSGVFGGAYGLNGPPLVLYGNMRKWSARHFRATLQAYFLPASLIGLGGYFYKGIVNREVLLYFLIALPAAIPAIFLGRYFNHRLKDDSFFKYIYIVLIVIGINLILNSF
jgi:uncharacterized membrane protein YfcA